MALQITISVTSSNHSAGESTRFDGDVHFTRSYDGLMDANGRYDADLVLQHGEEMIMAVARQLVKLAELDGGPLFTHTHRANALGFGEREVR